MRVIQVIVLTLWWRLNLHLYLPCEVKLRNKIFLLGRYVCTALLACCLHLTWLPMLYRHRTFYGSCTRGSQGCVRTSWIIILDISSALFASMVVWWRLSLAPWSTFLGELVVNQLSCITCTFNFYSFSCFFKFNFFRCNHVLIYPCMKVSYKIIEQLVLTLLR